MAADIDYLQYHSLIKANTQLLKNFDTSTVKQKQENDVQILCIVKNGAYYIEQFINYHHQLGVKQFTFIDNGSDDNTVNLAALFPFVRIFKNELPYKIYWHHFKRFMFEEYGKGYWNLLLDIDEFFEFPFESEISLDDLIDYNNKADFTAVVTQMVDLVPDEDILSLNKSNNFQKQHIYYSADNLKIESYNKILPKNKISNLVINFNMCGWRDKTFGVGDIMLTKHSFIKGDGILKYVHDHFVENASVADYTCILKHYKFGGDFKDYVENSVLEENHYDNSREYKKYKAKIKNQEGLNLYHKEMLSINEKHHLFENSLFEVSLHFLLFFSNKINFSKQKELFLKRNRHTTEAQIYELIKLRLHTKDYPKLKKEVKDIKNSYTWKIARFFTKIAGFVLGKKN